MVMIICCGLKSEAALHELDGQAAVGLPQSEISMFEVAVACLMELGTSGR
jgi:hypothetical protein